MTTKLKQGAQEDLLRVTAPYLYVVETIGHKVFDDGTRFFVIEEQFGGEWLLCWRNVTEPRREGTGSLLHRDYVRVLDLEPEGV